METFTWSPRVGAQGSTTYRTLKAQFGDGYAQEVADGINNEVQVWPLQFVGKEAYVQPILGFIRRHKGASSFLWTPPLGAPGFYKAGALELLALGAGNFQVSVTFQQVFRP